MKLYAVRASNNCRRPLATALHLGVELEVIEPDMMAGALKKPEYLAINPMGKVPTLVDGDYVLWEGRAIMQYIAAQKPGNSLWPDDAKVQADITRWQFWDSCHLSRGTGALAFENLFKPMFMKQEADPAAVEEGTKTFHQFAPILNAQLEGKKYILGDTLTLADFGVGGSFSYAAASAVPMDDYSHIKAWYERLSEVDAWKNTAPKMG